MPRVRTSPPARLVLRGTLLTLRRKCGKPTCRCARGALHETPALAYKVAGAAKILTLRPQDVPVVKAALIRYKRARTALAQQALAGLTTFRQRVEREKAAERLRG